MGFWVVRRTKRLWTDEEKRSICVQTTAPDVSVAQVARRYALNANKIFKWLRDARYAPGSTQSALDAPVFLPVEIVKPTRSEAVRPVLPNSVLPDCLLEIEIARNCGRMVADHDAQVFSKHAAWLPCRG